MTKTSQRASTWMLIVAVAVLAAAAGAGLTYFAAAGGDAPAEAAGGPPGGEGGGAPMGPPPAAVIVAEVETRELRNRFECVGRLRAVRQARVAAEVEGKLIEFGVDEGDVLAGGETVIAVIDGVWSELNVQALKADVASAQATLEQEERDLAQLEQLSSAGSAKPKEVEDARADVRVAKATLEAAQARQQRAAEEVARVRVVAPFDGLVVSKNAEVGEWAEPGSELVHIISRGTIDAILDVPEKYITAVSVGAEVEVVIDALGVTVPGKVQAINPSGTSAARTFPVKVRIDDANGKLMPGMSVVARLPVEEASPRLLVPRDAVQFAPTGAVVWVAAESEGPMPQAMPVGINVLFGEEDRFVIEASGASAATLATGTQVVVQGAEGLFPTRPLIIAPAGE